ncbi:hypothetical protein [Massilia sp. NP310]|uniref:hypothetical protein n=1 Tax=Massilia sp. NP310 TaxID=2861282 RepID=UPI001C6305E4|nr:hypothetical protein [Massilia sp. NP310]QYG02793.1 hypothetical protein KY496_05100 [Massilia sp. NP310]
MKLRNVTVRFLAMALLLSMLGILAWSSQSMSHTGLVHVHAADSKLEKADDSNKTVASGHSVKKHAHTHNAGDHSHDVPLQPAAAQLVLAEWAGRSREDSDIVRSAFMPPPERPPKTLWTLD